MAKKALADDPEKVKEVDEIFGRETPPEEVAAPDPEPAPPVEPVVETPAGDAPQAEEVSAEPTPQPEVVDYKARFEEMEKRLSAREQEFDRQREGMLRDLQKARAERRERRAQDGLTQPQVQAAQAQGIPVKWNEKGEAYIPQDAIRPPQWEIDSRLRSETAPMHAEINRLHVIAENPAEYRPVVEEMMQAFKQLNSMVEWEQRTRQMEPFESMEEALHFIEMSGLQKQFGERYPHIAPDRQSMQEFILSGGGMDRELLSRFTKGVLSRKKPAQPPVALVPPAPPVAALPGNKPRPHADRGGKAPTQTPNSLEREFDELTTKVAEQGAWSLDDKETERMKFLTKILSKPKAS